MAGKLPAPHPVLRPCMRSNLAIGIPGRLPCSAIGKALKRKLRDSLGKYSF